MTNTQSKVNRKGARALSLLVLLLMCVCVIFTAAFSRVYATGSVQAAAAVGQAWNSKRASLNIPDEKTASMTDFYYDVMNKNHTSAAFAEYADTVILISNAQELMMFSYACAGYLYSSTSSTVDQLGAFMRSASIKLGNNIDFAAQFIYYGTNSTVQLKSETDSGSGYYSNAVYDGYGKEGSTVTRMFLPITEFHGNFDGQGFEIRNLTVWRDSAINSGVYDAFFARISATATVENFGLVDAVFTADDNLHLDSGSNRTIASIAGSNSGVLRNVYALGTAVEGRSYLQNITTLGENTATGSAINYYTAQNANTTDGDWSTQGGVRDVKDESTGWFTSASKRNGHFEINYAAYPKLLGLRKSGSEFLISTAPQFVEYTHIYKESTSTVTAKILNDIDFSFIGDKAVIPMDSMMTGSLTSTLYSAAKDESVGTAQGATLSNMKITSYVSYSGGNHDWRNVGLFVSASNNTDSISVYNLNFVNCAVQVQNAVKGQDDVPAENRVPTAVRYAAGLLLGGARSINFTAHNVMSHSSVGAGRVLEVSGNTVTTQDTYMTQSVALGGLFGMADMSSKIVMSNCAVTGITGSGSWRYSVASGGGKTHYIGGFLGFLQNSGGGNGARFSNVYMGGEVRNFCVSSLTGQTSYEALRTNLGFIAGRSKAYSDVENMTAIDGIYVSSDAVMTAHPAASNAVSVDLYAGGLFGGATASANTASALSSPQQLKIDSPKILLGSTADSNPSYLLSYGSLIGTGAAMTLGAESAADAFALSNICAGEPDFSSAGNGASSLYYGGLFGNAGGATVKNFVSDKDIILRLPFDNVRVGGIAGSGDATITDCVNTADITVFTDTSDSGANKAQTVHAFGLAYNATASGCINVGDITVVASGATRNTTAIISGITHGNGRKVSSSKNGGKLLLTELSAYNAAAAQAARIGTSYMNGISYNGGGVTDGLNGDVTYNGIDYSASVTARGNFISTTDIFLTGITYLSGATNSVNNAPVSLNPLSVFGGNVVLAGIARDGAVSSSTNDVKGKLSIDLAQGVTMARNVWLSGIVNIGSASDCVNNADLTAPVTSGILNMGGISSSTASALLRNVNNGNITVNGTTGTVSAGGIVGNGNGTYTGNTNKGAITVSGCAGSVAVGGVVGRYGSNRESGNVNEGAIGVTGTFTGGGTLNVGGIFGEMTGTSTGAENRAKVSASGIDKSGGSIGMGGIAGRNGGTINSAANNGEVFADVVTNAIMAGGIAGYDGTFNTCVNNAAVTLSGGGAYGGRPYAVGGIVGRKMTGGDISECINYGAVTATAPAASNSINNFVGGILGQAYTSAPFYINYAMNFGEVRLTKKESNGAANVGGIMGGYGSSGSFSLYNCLNAANVTASSSNGTLLGTGGIVGGSLESASSVYISACANIGDVSVTSSLASVFTGGIIGNSRARSTLSISDSVNSGAVSGGAYVGGIAGGINGAALSVNAALNYGDVNGSNAGGIVGFISSGCSLTVDGAINYGGISASTAAAGIAALSSSSNTINLYDVVNYGAFSAGASNYGIAGAGTYSVRLAVHVEGSASVNAVMGGSGTFANLYYASNSGGASSTAGAAAIVNGNGAGQLYNSDFVIGAGEKEEAYYGASYNTSTVLAYSEKPYMTSSGDYHSATISASAPWLFAVTTSAGRQSGIYVGDNFDYLLGKIEAADLPQQLKIQYSDALKDTRQITLSRDNFYYDPYLGSDSETKIILKDSAKTGEDKQNLDPISYVGGNIFTAIIYPTSAYYINNLAAGDFTFQGKNTALASPQTLQALAEAVFSANAKIANFTAQSVVDLDTANRKDAAFQIARITFDVYQGDVCPEGESLYKRTFIVNVYFVDSDPSMEVKSSQTAAGDNGVYMTQSQGVNNLPTDFYNLDYDETLNGNEKSYALKYSATSLPIDKTAGSTAVADWDRGTLKFTFNLQSFSENAASGITTALYRKNDAGVFDLIDPAQYLNVYYAADVSAPRDNDPLEFPVGDDVVQINSYYVDVTLYLTNRLALTASGRAIPKLLELPSGEYKFTVSLSDGAEDYIRSFTFQKEKSGDTQMHYDAPSLAVHQKFASDGGSNVRANFKAVTESGMIKAASQTSTVSFAPTGFTGSYDTSGNFTGGGVFTAGISGRDRYGTLPDFSIIDANVRGNAALNLYSNNSLASDGSLNANFVSLTGYRSVLDESVCATVSMPDIKVTTYSVRTTVDGRVMNPGSYLVDYSFTITAENGINTGVYSHKYYFMTLPSVTQVLTKNNVVLNSATDEMGKTDSASYRLDLTATALATSPVIANATRVSRVEVYILTEVSGDDGQQSTVRTLVAQVDVAANGGSTVTPIGAGEDMTLPDMSLNVSASPNVFRADFNETTTGGKYAFLPYYRNSGRLYASGNDAGGDYYTVLPDYVRVTAAGEGAGEDITASTGYIAAEFNAGDALTVEKVVSRYSTLRDMSYTTKPNGAVLEKYVGGNPTTISSLTDNAAVSGYSKMSYVSLSEISPTNAGRPTSYRVVATYAAAEGDSAAMDSLSYSTYIIMRLYGENSPSFEAGYIDEFASIYMKNADGSISHTPLAAYNTVYLKDEQGADTADVDYVEYRIFLDEGERVSVRAAAENPMYYTDYDFVSYGPAKNKTFVITVDAPIDTPDGIYTVTLRTRINGIYTRTVSMLYLIGTQDDYRAKETMVDGVLVYRKQYTITRNVSATYEAFVASGSGLSIVMDKAGFNPDFTGTSAGAVTLSLDTESNAFMLDGADAATIYVHLALSPMEYLPDWGHQTFG